MIAPQLLELMQTAATTPWAMSLVTELMERQGTSATQLQSLRERSPGSPILWPFHAVQLPVAITEAQGAHLVDADGHEYLDLFLGFGTQALHGHNPPEVVARVREQLGRTVGNGYFHPVELELVDLLRRLTGLESFVFLGSGTEATEAAVRLCRAHTGRRTLVKFESAVHGTHDWGVQSSVALMHGHPLTPWPEHADGRVRPVPFARGVAPAGDELLILPHLDDAGLAVLEAHKGEIACVIMESCNISFPYAEKNLPFLKRVRSLCRELDIPFVLDEVQTGFRWGPGGANQTEGIDADLCTYGKVLSGLGIPLSAVGGSARLLSHASTSGLNLGDYGQKTTLMTTHAGNHLALLASRASLSLLEDKGAAYYERVRSRLDRLRQATVPLHDEGIPLHLVGYGDFIGTYLFAQQPEQAHDARALTERANPAATLLLSLALRREGLYTYSWPFVFLGDAYTDAEIEQIGATVARVAREMKAAGLPMTVPWAG